MAKQDVHKLCPLKLEVQEEAQGKQRKRALAFKLLIDNLDAI